MSQEKMTKWSSDRLEDYILLPAASGYVLRRDCFFVSHFWQTKDHPDPHGKILRLHQEELRQKEWSYIWVDWTCMPQEPRNQVEQTYFWRSLSTMSGIIRNCGFTWFYPPFEPRIWILYEVAEFFLTSEGALPDFDDIRPFKSHVEEMLRTSVQAVLTKHKYKSTYSRDEAFLMSWLEFLVLLKKLRLDIINLRSIMDALTWPPRTGVIMHGTPEGWLNIERFKGTITRNGEVFNFTPFPLWVRVPDIPAYMVGLTGEVGRRQVLVQSR